ncbi:MAG: M48 family metalloprotease [Betaproteobacteria bacterium]|nr:MAG: M48 family metalloprotease [Betaproteobacteria bacterium]
MHNRLFALTGIGILTALATVLLVAGRTDYEVSLDAALEIWTDIVRDADYIGLTVTRVSAEDEMKIGREIEQDILRWYSTGVDKDLRDYVEEVGQTLAKGAIRKDIEYRFHVINAPFKNAFAIPGGGVFITTGMIDFLENEAELAAILGHEISHIDLRHCIERLQYQLAARKVVGNLSGIIRMAHELVGIGYSEQQELEADRQGVLLSINAGYDVFGGLDVFVRLARTETAFRGQREVVPPPRFMWGELIESLWDALGQYFASHPPTRQRAEDLATLLRQNASASLGQRFYVGHTNYEDRVSRTSEERNDEWVTYTRIPALVDCRVAEGLIVPMRAEECPMQ